MSIRILAEVTYDFYTNTIGRDNNIQIVTEETKDNYYCKEIGIPFKKLKEGKVNCITGGVCPYLSVFKTLIINEEDFNKGEVKQYIADNLNAELVEAIKEELKSRIERVRVI